MSSAVFSALTLPLVLFEPEPISVTPSDIASANEPSPALQGFQPILDIFESGNKGLAIRYIGFSIVASVGAGIATAELLRQTARRFTLPGDRYAALAMDGDDLAPWPSEWADTLKLDTAEQEIPIPARLPAQELVAVGAGTGHTGFGYETSTAVLEMPMMSSVESLPVECESIAVPILDETANYTTCRVNVPHLEKRLFAVQFQDDYYRLVRAQKTRKSALAIAQRLNQQGNKVIITQDHETHSVWVLEPQAFPCSI